MLVHELVLERRLSLSVEQLEDFRLWMYLLVRSLERVATNKLLPDRQPW